MLSQNCTMTVSSSADSMLTNGSCSIGVVNGSDGGVEYFLLEDPAPQPPLSQHGSRDGNVLLVSTSEHHHASGSSSGIYLDTTPADGGGDHEMALPLLVSSEDTERSLYPQEEDIEPASTTRSTNSLVGERHHRRGFFRRNSRRRPQSTTQSSFHRSSTHPAIELSGLNYLNVVTYLAHVMIWWGVAVWGLDAYISTQWEMTQQYETLVTPATWAANYLWIPILLSQGLFAVAQLLPNYRSRLIVTNGTGFYFFYTVLLQIAYTFLYSFGLFIFSFLAALLASVALLSLLASQQRHEILSSSAHYAVAAVVAPLNRTPQRRRVCGTSVWEYVAFQFPFYLHAGWMILMAVDHFSLLVRYYASGSVAWQLAADIVAMAMLLVVATYALHQASGPDFVIPIVMLWSYVRIHCDLLPPCALDCGKSGLTLFGPSLSLISIVFADWDCVSLE
jgi:hypothetical protein